MTNIEHLYNTIHCMDCLDFMKGLPDNCIDAIVTDPPYGLSFMGKKWDYDVPNQEVWEECLRIIKPGGYLLAFAGTRTYHRIACAIEDAGFEVRDMIEWVYGSGFPKSLNIGKAVDKLRGNEREVVVKKETKDFSHHKGSMMGKETTPDDKRQTIKIAITKGTSEWEGWGTALKPAHEPICMARKPLAEKTVAENVLKYGTGGINIDESRVGTTGGETHKGGFQKQYVGDKVDYDNHGVETDLTPKGRFPANLIHDNSEEVRECFPESNSGKGKASTYEKFGGQWGKGQQIRNEDYGDSGNASRFFKSINCNSLIYQAKASKSERNKGCEDLEEKQKVFNGQSDRPSEDMKDVEKRFTTQPTANNHPTVKPIALMEYLVKLVTREGALVLDPFAGSGSTLIACKNLGRKYIGCEREDDYIPIINSRLNSTVADLFHL